MNVLCEMEAVRVKSIKVCEMCRQHSKETTVNINEIARLAGVSRATVSRYLNNGYVSDEKKRQIQKVIDETGYKPSAQAQQLRSGRTKLIGVILPKINLDSVSRMVAGISLVLAKEGYQLLLGNTDNDEKEELKYFRLFQANKVEGIILIGTILTREHYVRMKEVGVPVVVLGQQAEGYSCVYHDDYLGAKDVTRELLKKASHPGYIGVTQRDKAAGSNRRKGFLDAVAQWQEENKQNWCETVGFDPKMDMVEAEFNLESGYQQAKKLLSQSPSIDAIFCATDSIAIGAQLYLREQGIAIPQKVQLAGIGDTVMGRVAAVSLTTVHFFYKTSGIEAANMLLSVLESGEDIRREIKMGYKVLPRESTSPMGGTQNKAGFKSAPLS